MTIDQHAYCGTSMITLQTEMIEDTNETGLDMIQPKNKLIYHGEQCGLWMMTIAQCQLNITWVLTKYVIHGQTMKITIQSW